MRKWNSLRSASLVACVAAAAFAVNCSKSDLTGTTQKYAGSGSDWTWTLNADGTFTASESVSSVTVNGTFARLSTGFVKMTVTSATGTGAPAAGEVAYGLEVPGMALLVKPVLSSETQIITMVAAGNCPTADFTGNWIFTQAGTVDMTSTSTDTFGTFSWNNAGGYGILPSKYAVASYTSLGANNTHMAGTCANGTLTFNDGGGTAKMYLTSNGGALVKLSSGNGNKGVLVMPAVSVTQTALAGNYAGLLFDDNSTGGKTKPLAAVVNAAGTTITVNGLSDIDTGALDSTISGSVSIDAVNSPSAGLIKATVTASSTGAMACSAGTDVVGSGKNIIFCVGQSPGNNAKQFNALFVSH